MKTAIFWKTPARVIVFSEEDKENPAFTIGFMVVENSAQLVCCSALLTTTMPEMKNIVDAVNASELKGKVKIMVGGAPITQEYADEIGADCYTPDAATAAEAALQLCQEMTA